MCISDETALPPLDARMDVRELVDQFVLALTNTRIYSEDHPRVRSSMEELAAALRAAVEATPDGMFVIGAADGCLFHEGRPLLAASRSTPRLLQVLAQLQSGGLCFRRGLEVAELLTLLRFVNSSRGEHEGADAANAALAAAGCVHIQILPGYVGTGGAAASSSSLAAGASGPGRQGAPGVGGEGGGSGGGSGSAVGPGHDPLGLGLLASRRAYDTAFTHLVASVGRVVRGDMLELEATRSAVEGVLTQLRQSTGAMLRETHYDFTQADRFQFRHSIRTACLAIEFMQHVTQEHEVLIRVGTAALLHDLGKALVPYDVLHCNGKLSADQWAEMQRHPDHGARILMELGGSDPLAISVALSHHTVPGGGGYPRMRHARALQQPSYATRLVKICDVYEAITGYRPYREPATPIEAYRIMLSMGPALDGGLLHAFIRTNGLYPRGSKVELRGGATGWVLSQTQVPRSPVVQATDGRVFNGDDPACAEPVTRLIIEREAA